MNDFVAKLVRFLNTAGESDLILMEKANDEWAKGYFAGKRIMNRVVENLVLRIGSIPAYSKIDNRLYCNED